MPWVLIPGALEKLRRAAQLSRAELAKRTGLHLSTVIRHESGEQLTLHLRTVEVYEEVLGELIDCTRRKFVTWSDVGPEPSTPPPGSSDGTAPSPTGLRILDAAALRECAAGGELAVGRRFLVQGAIGGFDWLAEPVAAALSAPAGGGARFNIIASTGAGPPFPVTVFTRLSDHVRQLFAQVQVEVALVVVVVGKPPGNSFAGFPIFRQNRSRASFALVVEAILALGNSPT